MSPSWKFPARAEPSYKGSEPSRAEPSWGTSIFELKPSCQFFLMYSFFSSNFFSCFYQFWNHFNLLFTTKKIENRVPNLLKMQETYKRNKEKNPSGKNGNFPNFDLIFFSSWRERSRAKLSWRSFSSIPRIGLITNIQPKNRTFLAVISRLVCELRALLR